MATKQLWSIAAAWATPVEDRGFFVIRHGEIWITGILVAAAALAIYILSYI
jgi:hypothetical protein